MRRGALRWSPAMPHARSPCKRTSPNTPWRTSSRRRGVSPRIELTDVVTDVGGPGRGKLVEAWAVVGEEGPGRFLIAGEIAGEGGHDAIGHFLSLAPCVSI